MLKGRIKPIVRAVAVGVLTTVLLLCLSWALFSSSTDLNKRSAIAVLLRPDRHRVTDTPQRSVPIGECRRYGPVQPENDIPQPFGSSIVCARWERKFPTMNNTSYLNDLWIGTKYSVQAYRPGYMTGHSRVDGAKHIFVVLLDLAKVLVVPLALLLVIQIGVLVGTSYLYRISGSGPEDGLLESKEKSL